MSTKEIKYGDKISSNVFFSMKLVEIGVNKAYIGFFYLVDILDILINSDIKISSFSKDVYPIVAKKYDKTEWTVERNIRHLISVCWCVKLKNILNYSNNLKRPTCNKFIKLIKNYISLQIMI